MERKYFACVDEGGVAVPDRCSRPVCPASGWLGRSATGVIIDAYRSAIDEGYESVGKVSLPTYSMIIDELTPVE